MVEVKVLTREDKLVEVELKDADVGMLEWIVQTLLSKKGVVSAAYKKQHPIVSSPQLYVKTDGTVDAMVVLEEVIDELIKEIDGLRESLA